MANDTVEALCGLCKVPINVPTNANDNDTDSIYSLLFMPPAANTPPTAACQMVRWQAGRLAMPCGRRSAASGRDIGSGRIWPAKLRSTVRRLRF